MGTLQPAPPWQRTEETVRQLKIWELEDYQCPILGTCLTMGDLGRVARAAGMRFDEEATDYEVHGFFVARAKCPGKVAKLLQERLNRRHRRSLALFRGADGDEALAALWRERADQGDLAGPFWALMSHPAATPGLRHDVFGEVHMLSHVLGAAGRADLGRMAALERRAADLEHRLAEGRDVLRKAVAVWKRRCRDMEGRLVAEKRAREADGAQRASLGQALETVAVTMLRSERDALAEQGARAAADLLQSQARIERQAATIDGLGADLASLRRELAERDATVTALESALAEAMRRAEAASWPAARAQACPASLDDGCAGPCADAACGQCSGCPRLSGKCVLYVGGRCNLTPHYKALAGRYGCELLYHDGGQEQSPQHLHQLLSKADAVICPVSCVSHEACTTVKRACKGALKPLVLPSSSGLGGLARSLEELEHGVQ